MRDELDDDAMVTLTQAARELGVSKSLIIDWAERDLVQRHGSRYRWRYRIGDLRDVEIRTRNCDRRGVFPRKPKLIEV